MAQNTSKIDDIAPNTGQCHISAKIQSHAVVEASWVIICIDLYNGGLSIAVVAIFSDPCIT